MVRKEVPHLGERLKAIRETAGLSQQEVAFRSGLSISMVGQLEQGLKRDPRLSTLLALAEGFGLTLGQLMDQLTAPPKKPRRKGD